MDYPPCATVSSRKRAFRQSSDRLWEWTKWAFDLMVLLLQLVAVAVFLGAVTLHLFQRPLILLYLLLAVQFLVAGSLMPEVSVRVMGIGLGPVDLINVMVLAAAFLRMPRGPRGWQWLLLGAIALVIYGALTGYLRLGDAAMLGFRAELYFLIAALFVSTMRATDLPEIVRAIVWFGIALAGLAVARWSGLAPAGPEYSSDYLVERVIASSAALWVALAAMAALMTLFEVRMKRLTNHPWIVAGLCLAVVLLTQHRSVWVASAVMLAVVFLITQHRMLLKVGVVIVAGITVILVEGLGLGHGGTLAESLAFATSNFATWEWRLERWGNVWETHSARGLGAILFGSGYGYGWVTGIIGEWEVSPHNGYLQVAVRIGLIGAFLVFLPYYMTLRRLLTAGDSTTRLLWLWTIGILVYFIPYSGDMLTGVVLGAAIASLMALAENSAETSPTRSALVRSPRVRSPFSR
jgi:O-antigen ligase